MEDKNDWRQTPEGAEYLALVLESALANGWSRMGVGVSAGHARSLERFKERAQRFFAPKPPEQPREEDWRDSAEGSEYLALVTDAAVANGWSRRCVGNSARYANSLEQFQERAQRYFAPKPVEKTKEETWRDTEEGREYVDLVTDAALKNGWCRRSVSVMSAHTDSLEKFKGLATKYFAPKLVEKTKKETWRDTKEGKEYLALITDAALENGWSKGGVATSSCKSESLKQFQEKAQRFFAPKPVEKTKKETWRDTQEGKTYIALVTVAALENGWSQRSVPVTVGHAKSLEKFKEKAQRYFAPKSDETPAEKWGKWIREQQIAAEIPIVEHGTNWNQAWRVQVGNCPDNHPNLEQSARAYVAGKLKDLEYWKVVDVARAGGLEEKAELLQGWLLEERYNNFPLDTEKLDKTDQGKIDIKLLETAVMKVACKAKWKHLQSIFTKSFWIEIGRALNEFEEEAIAA